VLGLGLPERAGLAHVGDDLARPQAGGVDVGDRLLGNLALLVEEYLAREGLGEEGADPTAPPAAGGAL